MGEAGGHAGEQFLPLRPELRVGAQDALLEIGTGGVLKDAIPEPSKLSIFKQVDDVGVLELAIHGTPPAEASAFFPVESQLR